MLHILVAWSGLHGRRILGQLRSFAPRDWRVLDYGFRTGVENWENLPDRADLVVALVTAPEQAEMVPALCERVHAGAAIVPVDRKEWLPQALTQELRARLKERCIAAVFPHPFCSLTETDYNLNGRYISYDAPVIEQFAASFGAPHFDLAVWNREIVHAGVQRAAPCGCADFVARGLKGVSVEAAVEEARHLLRRYPCYGAPDQVGCDPARDSAPLDPVSEGIDEAIAPYKRTRTFSPR